MKILITGGTGLLGTALLQSGRSSNFEITATYCRSQCPVLSSITFARLDVSDSDNVMRLFDQVQPEVVIHAASIGSVDYAEQHRDETWAVNVDGTRNIAEACRRYGARLVFISSNAVFDGERPFYSEEDAVCPINYYGELKVEGERVVQTLVEDPAIVRPILMYGWPNVGQRGNMVTFWLEKFEQGELVHAVNDVWSKPLQVENCAMVCWEVILQGGKGIYHVAGADHVSLYEYAIHVANSFGADPDLVKSVSSSFFPQLVTRPIDTSFMTDKMESVLGVQPIGLIEGLNRMKAQRP